MAAAVGVAPHTGLAVDESLVEALASRRMLMVVDNCEHVLPAIVSLLERILGHCPHVHVLATSRERLAADGEMVVPLEPLELPEPDADPAESWARPAPALELLRDRIRAVRPAFDPRPEEQAALAGMCRQLDGLPLAIELAAARMATMGPLDVTRRLDRRLSVLTQGRRTAPTRHRTLRAAIEWSYDLLGESERDVFERASVFVGGFTLTAAEQVLAGEHQPAAGMADVIGALADKSLLVLDDRRSTTRYHMLDTLREFAHERLTDRGNASDAAAAHAEYVAALAREAEPHVRGPDEAIWVAALDAEIPNLRTAHEWARRERRPDLACEILASLAWFALWRMRAEVFSWGEWLAEARQGATGHRWSEALAVVGRGALVRGDLERAEELGRQAVAAADEDPAARFGWQVLGDVGLFSGNLEAAHPLLERAHHLAERAGDRYHCALVLGHRALARAYEGDPSALQLAAESRSTAAHTGNPTAHAFSEFVTGEVLMASDPERALAHLDRAVVTADRVSNEFVRGLASLSAASLRARQGDPADAAPSVVEVIDHWERGGNWRQQWITMRSAAHLLARLERYAVAAIVLGAIERGDAENVYGEDAHRLARLRRQLQGQLGDSLNRHIADGSAIDRVELLALVRGELRAAARQHRMTGDAGV
jgi:predicted ATPase/DNA-directed RNA polymerase subunit K/omega